MGIYGQTGLVRQSQELEAKSFFSKILRVNLFRTVDLDAKGAADVPQLTDLRDLSKKYGGGEGREGVPSKVDRRT